MSPPPVSPPQVSPPADDGEIEALTCIVGAGFQAAMTPGAMYRAALVIMRRNWTEQYKQQLWVKVNEKVLEGKSRCSD